MSVKRWGLCLPLLSWHNGATVRNCSFPDAVILSVSSFGLSPLTRDICDMNEYEARVRKRKCLSSHSIFDPTMSQKEIEEALGRDKQDIFSKQKFPRIVSTNVSCLEVFYLQIFSFEFEFELGLHNITNTWNLR